MTNVPSAQLAPTAARIYSLQSVTDILANNTYVSIIALDFSKAFDTVCYYTLLEKMAQLDIPDAIYNWLVHFFSDHSHSTKYASEYIYIGQYHTRLSNWSSVLRHQCWGLGSSHPR